MKDKMKQLEQLDSLMIKVELGAITAAIIAAIWFIQGGY